MADKAWHLPWAGENVPHAVLDILRGCNITCRACYNRPGTHIKSFDEITEEVDLLQKFRKLHSISIVGGESTLHPELCRIIRLLKSRKLGVELFTNGLALDDDLLGKLREAGTDLIFVHIDSSQRRPDLPADPTSEDVFRLLDEKSRLVTAHDIEAGIAITGYPDKVEEISATVEFFLHSPSLTYLIVTLCREVEKIAFIEGDLASGMSGALEEAPGEADHRELHNDEIHDLLKQDYGLSPFGRLGSNLSKDHLRWVSYLVADLGRENGDAPTHDHLCLKASVFEKAYLRLHKLLTGRYPFYVPQSPVLFRLQLLLNGICRGAILPNGSFLAKTFAAGSSLKAKRLLFQDPAMVGEDGRVIHCRHCPDAVVKDGQLIPVCICDRVRSPGEPCGPGCPAA